MGLRKVAHFQKVSRTDTPVTGLARPFRVSRWRRVNTQVDASPDSTAATYVKVCGVSRRRQVPTVNQIKMSKRRSEYGENDAAKELRPEVDRRGVNNQEIENPSTSPVSQREITFRFNRHATGYVAEADHILPIKQEAHDGVCTSCGFYITVGKNGDKEYGHRRGSANHASCPHRPSSVDPEDHNRGRNGGEK